MCGFLRVGAIGYVFGSRAGRERSSRLGALSPSHGPPRRSRPTGVVTARIEEACSRSGHNGRNGTSAQPPRLSGLRDSEDPAKRIPGHPVGARRIGSSQPRRELVPERRPLCCRQRRPDRP